LHNANYRDNQSVKDLTRQQLQSRKEKAVRFTRDVLGDPDRAGEIEDESLEDYAERRKIALSNPGRKRTMATLKQVMFSMPRKFLMTSSVMCIDFRWVVVRLSILRSRGERPSRCCGSFAAGEWCSFFDACEDVA
jgi:hypothetical protein